jgi:hypothetical protein
MHQISLLASTWTPGLSMRRIPVHSTSVASIGYLPVERELEIKFRASGDVYRYFDVPGEEYAAFMAAESKGSYSRMLMDSLGMMQQLGVVPSA